MQAITNIDVWTRISNTLPYGNTSTDVEKRKQIFRKFDKNGNGQLSLIEVKSGLKKIVIPEFSKPEAKLFVKEAFDAAKKKIKGATKGEDHNVSEEQFVYLLYYLRLYYEY